MKKPKLRIRPDEDGKIRLFLYAANGAELFRSPPVFKRGNGLRSLDRIRAAMAIAINDALAEAELEPGPRAAKQGEGQP